MDVYPDKDEWADHPIPTKLEFDEDVPPIDVIPPFHAPEEAREEAEDPDLGRS